MLACDLSQINRDAIKYYGYWFLHSNLNIGNSFWQSEMIRRNPFSNKVYPFICLYSYLEYCPDHDLVATGGGQAALVAVKSVGISR